MGAYYNEIEPYAAQWLRNLIKAGHIAEGDVDERSIVEVEAADLRKYDQCHFFAGIGVWSYALRAAGWGDDRKVWTGSCPCQPFSVAGLGQGFADERHIWPVWAKLIEQCRPDVLFGEQVANNDALAWLDVVQADLEAARYAVGTIDLCAAGLGAPHLRQRLWWVADSGSERRQQERGSALTNETAHGREGRNRLEQNGDHVVTGHVQDDGLLRVLGVAAGTRFGLGQESGEGGGTKGVFESYDREDSRLFKPERDGSPGVANGHWRDSDFVWCRDGKYRPVEPGTFPLAHGVTNRVGRLRATGNALVAPVAEAFVRAYMDVATGGV